jgi:chromatin structure-remodeling complex protein RSC7
MSGKIIIKPRRAKDSLPSSSQPTASPDPGPSESERQEEEEEETQLENENEGAMATEDDALSEAGGVVSQENAPRPRGRPKGSGKAKSGASTSTPAGTPRPRGRPRGTGRGAKARGRGRGAGPAGLVIRLPGRAGEDGATPGPEGDATEGATEEVAEEPEPEGPMGGGKPFRKIHGKVYIMDGDELITDEDPKGDTKIDPWGNLLEGVFIHQSHLGSLTQS